MPANAPWQYRDRHVCSERCNRNLIRQFSRRVRRGELVPPAPEPLADLRTSHGPRLFRTVPGDTEGEYRYEFEGYGPLPGDVVERHWVYTTYLTEPVERLPVYLAELAPRGALIAAHESGHFYAVPLDEEGYGARLILGDYSPDGQRRATHSPFEYEGRRFAWAREHMLRPLWSGMA